MAAVLACGDEAALSHSSAAALWGLVSAGGPVDVTGRGKQGRRGIRLHHGRLRPEERTVRDRIPVTTVARTLLDLADVLDEDRLARLFEEADRLNLLRVAALERVCEKGVGRRGVGVCRRLIASLTTTPRTRTPLEDRFMEFYRRHLSGLPTPHTNVSVLDREVDAYWPQHRLVVEMDSWEFHRHRAAFESDRARDIAFRVAGYQVVRLTDRRLKEEPDAVAFELRQLLTA
ncbi:MAG TPA: DUF559 domain-containing protein [Solirubrobacterales bacterium]|nr:DUF559 domain-containing protein [Solirubrobacterales bacterium]